MSHENPPSSLLEAFVLRQTEPFMLGSQRSSSPPLAPSNNNINDKRSTTDILSNNRVSRNNKRVRQNPSSMTATVHSSELSENRDMLRLCIDLPGIPAKDVQVAVESSVLTIKATRRSYSIDGQTCLREHHILKRYGLDTEVLDIAHLVVKLDLGVLTICVPKKSRSEDAAAPPVPIPQDEEDSQTTVRDPQFGGGDLQSTGAEDRNHEYT